jgi:putative nucleotidyltransferase with HDIG domain
MGELSKLLLGSRPAEALRLARDTGALVEVLPEAGPTIGYGIGSDRQPLPLDEHLFAVVQHTADAGDSLPVRLCALLHDLGKPEADRTEGDHAQLGAKLADRILRRLRYPNALRQEVVRLVAGHAFWLDGPIDALFARRFLVSHGIDVARELVAHKRADLATKQVEPRELEHLEELALRLEEERESPHRLADLAVDGHDLIELGYREGPALGGELARLLDLVVDRPELNDRETLLEEARRCLP